MVAAPLERLHPGSAQFWVELLPWLVAAVAGSWLAFRSPPGGRAGWFLVAAICLVIVADKAVDVLQPVTQLGRQLVAMLDPETRLRGPRVLLRVALLGGLFLAGCLGFLLVLRRDQDLHKAKLLAIAGLVAVMGYLGARLLPAVAQSLTPWMEWTVQGGCWLCVIGGELLSLRRGSAPPVQRRRSSAWLREQ